MGLGPSTKETTLHYYRDPIVEHLTRDADVDFAGIMLVGTSDSLEQKQLVAGRAGVWAEAMGLDGALVSLDSWGNCHIDFAEVMASLGERRLPLVGLSFVGNQAAFVVTNSSMDSIIDLNKTTEGVESLIVGQNTTVELDALKATSILKNKIRKKSPERDFTACGSKNLRRLIRRHYAVEAVRLVEGQSVGLDGRCLLVDPQTLPAIAARYPQVHSLRVHVIRPGEHRIPVNSILDFAPIAVKNAGRPGEGITHLFSGVQVMLTAAEESGFQPVNCGSAHGILAKKVVFGRRGTPDAGDCILHVDVCLEDGQGRTREGISAAHFACDEFLKPLRDALSTLGSSQATLKEELWDVQRPGAMRVLYIKLVAGLGCLYDTRVMPQEPGSCLKSISLMDAGNLPLLLTSNEIRDGMVHSLT